MAATRPPCLLSFIAMRKRNAVEPFAWFRDVLTRLATHPIHRIDELLPHNWQTLATAPRA
jgi:transposase